LPLQSGTNCKKFIKSVGFNARHQCLTPVILATWETEVWRIKVQGQPREIVHKTPSPKNNRNKMDWRHGSSNRVPVLQSQSPEFKLQSHQKKERERERENCFAVGGPAPALCDFGHFFRKMQVLEEWRWRENCFAVGGPTPALCS
jgi:hypothetical protein